MKKGLMLLLLAVCFASISFAPEKSKNTQIANMVKKVSDLSGLKYPNKIFPGQTLVFPFPNPEDRWMENADKGDCVWTMSRNLLFGRKYTLAPDALPILPVAKPAPALVPVISETENSGWLWFLLVVAAGLLILAGYLAFKNEKLKDEKKKIAEENKRKQNELERELEATKNKLPIVAPPIVNALWLIANNPVSNGIISIDDLHFSGIKEYGKKPDLIVRALVSTNENAISMNFSHGRKANTGLKDVPVYLGWNLVDGNWVEVGMIATICSNGFVVSPEKVVPMNQLFTNTGLVDNQHPVVYESVDTPKDTKYPCLLKSLIIKYHEKSIVDLRRAGAIVIPKN